VKAVVATRLREKFNAIPDVKFASTEPDPTHIFQNHVADLVVETWMGGRLYIYLIGQEPRLRELRSTLRENSRSGIGTLFLVDASLLPDERESHRIEDWQFALFSLNDSWIYSYRMGADGQALVQQVHFSPTPYADHYRVWHMVDFDIETCVIRHREYEEGIRGSWVVGDLASTHYKRRINYERQHRRYHYSTKQTRDVPVQPPSDQLMKYYQMLGLERSATEKEVKKAFRQMALKVHPDVSALPRIESERRIKELNEAYEFIKDYHGWS